MIKGSRKLQSVVNNSKEVEATIAFEIAGVKEVYGCAHE